MPYVKHVELRARMRRVRLTTWEAAKLLNMNAVTLGNRIAGYLDLSREALEIIESEIKRREHLQGLTISSVEIMAEKAQVQAQKKSLTD